MIKLITLLFALFALSTPTFAQNSLDNIDKLSASWDQLAQEAQTKLDSGDPAVQDTMALRSSLIEDRAEAQAVIDELTPPMDQVNKDLQMLTSTIPEGTTPSAEKAAKLAEFQSLMDKYEVPILSAQLARDRADRLLEKVSELQRQEFGNALMKAAPSPLLPYQLTKSIKGAGSIAHSLIDETFDILTGNPITKTLMGLPKALILIAVGFFLAFRAPKLIVSRLNFKERMPNNRIVASLEIIVFRLLLIIPALIGINLLFSGIDASGLFGTLGQTLSLYIRFGVLAFVIGYWLPRSDLEATIGNFIRVQAGLLLMLVIIVYNMVDTLNATFAPGAVETDQTALVLFALTVLIALCIPVVWAITQEKRFEDLFYGLGNAVFGRVLGFLRKALRGGALLSLVLAVFGYFNATWQLFTALMLTFFIMLAALKLYEAIEAILDIWMPSAPADIQEAESTKRSLLSIGIGGALMLLALPFIALAWGASVADLQDVWVSINNGVTIGDINISAIGIIQIALVFFAGLFVVRGIKRVLSEVVLPRTGLDIGGQTAITSLFGYAGYTVAAIVAMSAAGLNLSSLAVVFGALSVGIGFGLQNIVSNFVSGIILLIERPIKKGDWISVNGEEGFVRHIAVRSTEIETFDRASVIIPNADLVSQSVTNWMHSSKSARVRVPIGVAYDSDEELVERLLLEAAKTSDHVLKYPEPKVFLMDFGDSSINFEVRFFIREADFMLSAKSETNKKILKSFREHGVSIPFPQQEVRLLS